MAKNKVIELNKYRKQNSNPELCGICFLPTTKKKYTLRVHSDKGSYTLTACEPCAIEARKLNIRKESGKCTPSNLLN